MTVFTDDSAEEKKQAKRANKHAAYIEALLKKAVNSLHKTEEGRTYLWWLLEITKAYGHNAYRQKPTDTAFILGQQSIGQMILTHLMQTNPKAFTQLLLEKQDEYDARANPDIGDDASSGDDDDTDDSGTRSASPEYN